MAPPMRLARSAGRGGDDVVGKLAAGDDAQEFARPPGKWNR